MRVPPPTKPTMGATAMVRVSPLFLVVVLLLPGLAVAEAFDKSLGLLSPERLDFGVNELSITLQQTVSLRNEDESPVSVGTLQLADTDAFRLVTDECSRVQLAPDDACEYSVKVVVDERGLYQSTLEIPFDGGESVLVQSLSVVRVAERLPNPGPDSFDADLFDLLATFYFMTNGDDWLVNDGWLDVSVPPCEWSGAMCSPSYSSAGADVWRLIDLRLPGNNLTGTITSYKRLFQLAGVPMEAQDASS